MTVETILTEIEAGGDVAVRAHSERFDKWSPENFRLSEPEIEKALSQVSKSDLDDIRFAQCLEPPLTTIAQPMRAIGEGTVRLLLEILNGHHVTPVSVTLPHTLQVRSSTAPPRRNAEC